jgi:hypothetical protein
MLLATTQVEDFDQFHEVPAIMKEAGHKGRPEAAEFVAECNA